MANFDVFISYSRKDDTDGFVTRMKAALEAQGLRVWMDDTITNTTKWWVQIEASIERANNFLLIISEHSLASEWCQKEIAHAFANGKRFIPFQLRAIDAQRIKGGWLDQAWEQIARKNWQSLRDVQWISEYVDAPDFDVAVARITADAKTDPNYVEAHTRLLLQTQAWRTSGESPGAHLSGAPLAAAEAWLATWDGLPDENKTQPVPTEAQRVFIATCRAAEAAAVRLKAEQEARTRELETQRERAAAENAMLGKRTARFRLAAGIAGLVGVIALGLTVLAFGQTQEAQQQVARAGETLTPIPQTLAAFNGQIATAAAEGTQVALDAQISRAAFYADLSQRELAGGNVRAAVLLGQAALLTHPDGYFPAGHDALLDGLASPGLERLRLQHDGPVRGAQALDDGRILSWSDDGTVRLWNGEMGEYLLTLRHEDSVYGAATLDDGRILSWSSDGTVRLWDTAADAALLTMRHEDAVFGAQMMSDGRILSWSRDDTVRLWNGGTGDALMTLRHNSPVNGAQMLDDGRIMSWSWDGTVRLWDGSTGEQMLILHHANAVYGAQMLTDGGILSWSSDNTIRLWNANTGYNLLTLNHEDTVRNTQMLDDGRILSWSWDDTVRLWDGVTGAELLTLRHESAVNGAESVADGYILSWSQDGTVRLWDGDTGEALLNLQHDGRVTGAQMLSNGYILSWSEDFTFRFWDRATGEEVLKLTHEDAVLGAQILDDGRILSWSMDETIRIWDQEIQAGLLRMPHEDAVFGAQMLAGGSILSWSEDNTLRLWDAVTGEELWALRHENRIVGAQILDDGRVLSWSWDNAVRLSSGATGEELLSLHHENSVIGAQMLEDGRILSWSGDGTVRLWDGGTGEELLSLHHESSVSGVQMLDDGRIFSWSDDGVVRVWDRARGEEMLILRHDYLGTNILPYSNVCPQYKAFGDGTFTPRLSRVLNGAEMLPDERIFSWSEDSTVRLWDWETGVELLTLYHDAWVNGVQMVSEERILSWSGDGTVRLWDSATGEQLITLQHEGEVIGSQMLPDGHILSWATDCVVRLWDEAAGAELLTLRHDGRVNGAQMLDDGRILSWSDDGTVRLWVVEPQALLEIVAELQLMPFTSQEREQFFMPPLPPTATPTPFPTVTPLPPITVLPTLTALPTLTPSPLPTSQFVDFAIIGEQQGEVVPVRYASQTWRYAGSEGEQLTIRVLADNPGSGSDPLTWGAEGKLDTWLFVYTPNGSLLAENDDRNPTMTPSGGVADTDSELTIVLPEDGIYSFVIGSAYGGQTSGEYTLVVEAGGDATLAVTPSAMPSFTPVPTPDG